MFGFINKVRKAGRAASTSSVGSSVRSGISRAASVSTQDLVSVAGSVAGSVATSQKVGFSAVNFAKKALKYGSIALVGHEVGETVEDLIGKKEKEQIIAVNQTISVFGNQTSPHIGAEMHAIDSYGCVNSTVVKYVECLTSAKQVEFFYTVAVVLLIILLIMFMSGLSFMLFRKGVSYRKSNTTNIGRDISLQTKDTLNEKWGS